MADQLPLKLGADGATITRYQTGDTLALTQGGTGATSQGGAQTALALVPGTHVQAFDADLSALAGLTTTGIISRTGAGTAATRTLQAPAAGFTITNSDGVAGDPTFVLANDLSALEALASTGIAVRTGTDAWTQRSLATAGAARITVTNGDGVAGNPTVDLATVTNSGTGAFNKLNIDSYGRVTGTTAVVAADITALVDATYVNVGGDTMTNFLTLHADPTSALHAATKQYVDSLASGIVHKDSTRAATTANIATLAGGAPSTLDGVTLAANDRVLVKDQSTASQNGIYIVQTVGAGANGTWVRASDADATGELKGGSTVWVNEGTTLADTGWSITTDGTITIGSTNITWTQTSGLGQVTAGAGLTKTGNTLDVGTASSARIVVNADNIDLATVSNSATGAFNKLNIDSYGRVTGTTAVVAADISALLDSDLTALANTATTGLYTITAVGTSATRTLQAPAAGFTITNGSGVSGNPTFVLANDLSALEALASTGIAVRSGTDTWVQRSLATASSARITVTNGDGIAGNPTVDLATTGVGAGTYNSVTVDTYGRVTSATASSSSIITDSFTNGEAGAIAIGRVVYVSASGSVRLALASALGTADGMGLVADTTIASSANGSIANAGYLSATTGQWDAVTGQTGGLTFGGRYYISNATAGMLTTSAPASGFVKQVGIAMSTTKMSIQFGPLIQL